MIYWQLFLSFLQIGVFSFGGGYAAMPLIQAQVIEKHAWLTQTDFADLVTIAEMTPGPIAVNSATFVGNLVAGIPGAVCATIGVILPSCVFVTILAYFYTKYRNLSLMQGILQSLRPAVVAMIFTAGLKILIPAIFRSGALSLLPADINWRILIYFIVGLILLRRFHLGPIKVMVGCGVAELIASAIPLLTK